MFGVEGEGGVVGLGLAGWFGAGGVGAGLGFGFGVGVGLGLGFGGLGLGEGFGFGALGGGGLSFFLSFFFEGIVSFWKTCFPNAAL